MIPLRNINMDGIAKAIYLAAKTVSQPDWDKLKESGREAARKQARAALAEMPRFTVTSAGRNRVYVTLSMEVPSDVGRKIVELLNPAH